MKHTKQQKQHHKTTTKQKAKTKPEQTKTNKHTTQQKT